MNRKFSFENASLLGAVGGVNTGDSLAAVNQLIFIDKKYTMEELLKALDADWDGYEKMRQDFIKEMCIRDRSWRVRMEL